MKCIKNDSTGKIVRVVDSEAFNRVGLGWSFVPKSEWKESRKTSKSEKDKKDEKELVQ